MSYVRSFEDFYPPKRFDGIPFSEVVIEEAAEEAGAYAAIDTVVFDSPDSNPENPQARSFTTSSATRDPAWYRLLWKDTGGGEFLSAPVYLSATATTYATPGDLRAKLGVDAEVLGDVEAAEILSAAEDLIDDRLGNRPVDEDTGRKVVPAEEDAWRVEKLAKATLEVAAVLYRDPGVESRQRVRSVSGDVSTSGPYGPAYGERAESLLSASGLAVRFARASNRRRNRAGRIAQAFAEEQP